MKVLISCEQSGVVRDAFRNLGHDAWSCDTEPTRRPGPHYECDARLAVTKQNWDLMIAHPPCTYLCNSGVRWLHEDAKRWLHLFEAADFFCELLEADVPLISVENPQMHKYAKRLVGRGPDQYIQPYQFGHGETKKTGLWLKGLPGLKPTNEVDGRHGRIHRMPPGPERGYLRSITYQGIADAMAEQWGGPLD